MLKPEHLITLREAVRLGSFSQAGNRLGTSAAGASWIWPSSTRSVRAACPGPPPCDVIGWPRIPTHRLSAVLGQPADADWPDRGFRQSALDTPGTGDAMVIDGMFARGQLRPRTVGVSDDVYTTIALVSGGLRAAVLPRLAVTATDTSGVEVYAPAWLNISRSVFGLYRPGSTDPALVDLLDRLGSGPLNDD